jgi:hypothetical protein
MSDTDVVIDADPRHITTALMEEFDAGILEEKNGFKYLPHEAVRQRLIEATDNIFDWSIEQVLFRDDNVSRSKGTHPTVMVVIGTLTIPGLGSRAGVGTHPLIEGSGEDAAYKSADSDAFKRAAMAFGVGLYLYKNTDAGRVARGNANQNRNQQTRQADPAPRQNGQAPKSDSPPQIKDPNAPATDAQIGKIKYLMKKHNIDPDEIDFDQPPMTKGEASAYIDSLEKDGTLPTTGEIDDPKA